jgi:hypothetical protein
VPSIDISVQRALGDESTAQLVVTAHDEPWSTSSLSVEVFSGSDSRSVFRTTASERINEKVELSREPHRIQACATDYEQMTSCEVVIVPEATVVHAACSTPRGRAHSDVPMSFVTLLMVAFVVRRR